MDSQKVSCQLCMHSFAADAITTLHPCGCVSCKDCLIQLLWAGLRTSNTVVCLSCGGEVVEDGNIGTNMITANPNSVTPVEAPLVPGAPSLLDDNHPADLPFLDDQDEFPATKAGESPKKAAALPTKKRKPTPVTTARPSKTSKPSRKITPDQGQPNGKARQRSKTVDEWLLELESYRAEHETVSVSHGVNRPLAQWLYEVRTDRRRLTLDEQARLHALGWKTDVPLIAAVNVSGRQPLYRRRKTFEERLSDLRAYKQKHGDCVVPYQYAGDRSLGEWVKDVRRGQLQVTYDQRKQLTALGFCWETRTNRFDRMFKERVQRLELYKKRFGNCDVPWEWKEDKQLSEWCNTQRKANRKGKLQPDRKKMLDDLGFNWRTNGSKESSSAPQARSEEQAQLNPLPREDSLFGPDECYNDNY